MPSMPIAVLSQDASLRQSLSAQLALIGESVVDDLARAAALFLVVEEGHSTTSLPAGVPVVLCDREGNRSNSLAPSATVARVSLPVGLTQLETAVALLYRQQDLASASPRDELPEVIGDSEPMLVVKSQARQVAGGESNVLLTGPSGTGKSYLAEVIHRHSARAAGPFVPINCGAIPAELVESELFGHEKGAFTGAHEQRPGRFERARGGTLFLDEIGDLPYPMQVKLLRAIQERVFERVGGVESLNADVRIIAATNADLEAAVANGEFREDLYYRLNVFPIAVPSLAQRPGDLPLLVEHFCAELQAGYGAVVRLTSAALTQLGEYPWPGNLRELRNLLERLSVAHPGELIDVAALPQRYRGQSAASEPVTREGSSGHPEMLVARDAVQGLLPVNGIDLKGYLAELEQSLIEQALRDSDSVVARAADRLHIRRTTLVEKMRKYGIERRAH